jgi:nucleoid-associated protein YgaU
MTALLDTPLPQRDPRVGFQSGLDPMAPAIDPGLASAGSVQTFAAPPLVYLPPVLSRVASQWHVPPGTHTGKTVSVACLQRSDDVSARQAVAAGAAAHPLRLTRRARLLLTLVTVLSLLTVVGLAALNADPGPSGLQDAPGSVVVQTGDTLWQIAAEVAPAEDPSAVMALLRAANDLDGSALQPGQVLVVPRG